MISPPSPGVAFSDASDGDVRGNPAARSRLAARLGIPDTWATVNQVHGADVLFADRPGNWGSGDALWTTTRALPIGIFTADCFGVVLEGGGAVGVAHAGWRGVKSGVVPALLESMESSGIKVSTARIGPGIGPCCFEVGQEVVDHFTGSESTTDWGTPSVDLRSAIEGQLPDVEITATDVCTRHETRWFSHRENGTTERMVTLAWL